MAILAMVVPTASTCQVNKPKPSVLCLPLAFLLGGGCVLLWDEIGSEVPIIMFVSVHGLQNVSQLGPLPKQLPLLTR